MIFLLMLLGSCDTADIEGNSILSERALQIERLANRWMIDQVVYENVDVTEEFGKLQIEFKDDFTWEATNSGVVFGQSGVWDFIDDDLNTIEISGTIASITISADVNILLIVIEPSGIPLNGRTAGLGGEYRFQFSVKP